MEFFKSRFGKPDLEEQRRKCNALMRSKSRKLDREIANMKQLENKTRAIIIQADKRALNPQRQQQAEKDVRSFARELIRYRKSSARLVTYKAQLESVRMQVEEAFAMHKIKSSIGASVGVMRDVSSLIRLPELSDTMRELSTELIKAGIIEEMVGEVLPDIESEEEAAEGEVDKVLGEIIKNRMSTARESAPEKPRIAKELAAEKPQEEEELTEGMMNQMRERLEVLRS